jgi:chromosome segregation ATPase
MTSQNFVSDQDTITALQQLTDLIHQGLQQAWDPNIITQAKAEINQTAEQCKEQFHTIHQDVEDLQGSLLEIDQRSGQLTDSIVTAEKVTEVITKMGGPDQLRQDFDRLEQLRSITGQIGEAQAMAQQLQQQTEQLRTDGDRLGQTLTQLGGADALLDQLAQLKEIASQLAGLDRHIDQVTTAIIDRYLPSFEAGKEQIAQWRSEVKDQLASTLANLEQQKREVNGLIKDLTAKSGQISSQLTDLEQQQLKLEPLLTAIAQLAEQLGGQDLLQKVAVDLELLDETIAQQRRELVSLKTDLRAEFQKMFEQELEHFKNEQLRVNQRLLSENNQLKEEIAKMSQELNYNADQLRRLQAVKCDRPVWTLSNLRRPTPPYLP